jgi:hypothetical protein
MYSKLMRLLAQAQVTFSSCLCVQYGKGNEGSTVRFGQLNFRASVAAVKFNAMDLLLNDGDDDEKGGSSEDGYPVIEFRMVNDRANSASSEIWDAQISGVVQLLKEEQPKAGDSSSTSSRDLSAKAEGGESTLDLEKVVYYPVKLDPDSHPHFSRIWYARHVLNAESPLLKREFRDMIAQDGKWDPGKISTHYSACSCALFQPLTMLYNQILTPGKKFGTASILSSHFESLLVEPRL